MAGVNGGNSEGRVALITGANTGIGRETALALAARGITLYLAGRSLARTESVLAQIAAQYPRVEANFLPLDLADLGSVAACARAFTATGRPLHLLINNAGVAGERGLTPSGFERAFGVNHMGHFVLTAHLLPVLRQSAPARIITVASRAHRRVNTIDWETLRRPTATRWAVREYAVSKLANVLFSAELGRRLQGTGITTYALHPGVIDTDIWRHAPRAFRWINRIRLSRVGRGAATSVYCATSAAVAADSGLYYSDEAVCEPSPAGRDPDLARQLWNYSKSYLTEV